MRRGWDGAWSALADALRAIRGYPGTAAVSIGLFAFGTAFVVLAVVLAWRSFVDPKDSAPRADEMLVARTGDPARGFEQWSSFGWRYAYIARRQSTLACWVAARLDTTTVQDRDGTRHFADARRIGRGFRECWGLTLVQGREFRAEDHEPGAERVAIVDETLWREVFGADRSLVGDTVEIGREEVRVVGISTSLGKPDFGEIDVWLPASDDEIEHGDLHVQVQAYGRPREGVSFADARRELAQLDADYVRDNPDNIDAALQGTLHRHEDVRIPAGDRELLWASFVPFVGVFLLACANASGLLLIEFAGRARATALRMALGASRRALVLRLVIEGLLLALVGGAFGMVALRLLLGVVPVIDPSGFLGQGLGDEPWDEIAVVVAPVAILVGTMLIALFPGLTATRLSVHEVIQDGARSVSGGRRVGRLRDAIANFLVALSYVLVVASVSLAAGMSAAFDRPLGYETEGLVTAAVRFPECERRQQAAREARRAPGKRREPDPEHCLPQRRFAEGLAALPFVEQVALGSGGPVWMGEHSFNFYAIDQERALPLHERPVVIYFEVEAGFFELLGTRLVSGRFIDERDIGFGNCSANLSESLADRHGGPEAVLGKTLWTGLDGERRCTVVGVVADMNLGALPVPPPEATTASYVSRQVSEPGEMETYLLRVDGDPEQAVATIADWIDTENGGRWELLDVHAVDAALARERETWIGILEMFGIVGTAALLFAGLGIYGIVAYAVTVRRGEHALRMALGASGTRVALEIVTRQVRATWPGLALGVVVSLVTIPLFASLGLPMAFDLVTGVGALLIILGAVVFAALLPALRAGSIDPWKALREE